jgi:hypothetical protein
MKIYVRPRTKVGEGAHHPMFRIVAVTGKGEEKLKVEASHFRKKELEMIAADLGAEIVMLEPAADESGKDKK